MKKNINFPIEAEIKNLFLRLFRKRNSWSSSGHVQPELASFGPYDIFEYTFMIPDDGYCRALIRNAYDIIAYLVIAGEGEYLSQRMNLCHPVATDDEADVASLYENTIRAILTYINEYQ